MHSLHPVYPFSKALVVIHHPVASLNSKLVTGRLHDFHAPLNIGPLD
jgi:hypothetical protein